MCIVTSISSPQSFIFEKKRIYISNGAGYIQINKKKDLKNEISLPKQALLEIKVKDDSIKLITKILENKYTYYIFTPTSFVRTLQELYGLNKEDLVADVELKIIDGKAEAIVKIKTK